MSRDINFTCESFGCPNCGNDGELIPISGVVKREAYHAQETEFMCQRCGYSWVEECFQDDFIPVSNDEREC